MSDFGDPHGSLTKSTLSPERWEQTAPATPQSDVYALAACLCFLLALIPDPAAPPSCFVAGTCPFLEDARQAHARGLLALGLVQGPRPLLLGLLGVAVLGVLVVALRGSPTS